MHFYTVSGFPYSANKKSLNSYIFELINLVGRPSCLKYGSIEWENVFKQSNPFYKHIVYWAITPPVAY